MTHSLEELRREYESLWLVWSYKHSAWWGPRRCGYTATVVFAGLYDEGEARRIEASSDARAQRLADTVPLSQQLLGEGWSRLLPLFADAAAPSPRHLPRSADDDEGRA